MATSILPLPPPTFPSSFLTLLLLPFLLPPPSSSLPACSIKEFMATNVLSVHSPPFLSSSSSSLLPSLPLPSPFPKFPSHVSVFQHCPFLVRDSVARDLDKLIAQWKSHKYKRPVRGAIILNHNWNKVGAVCQRLCSYSAVGPLQISNEVILGDQVAWLREASCRSDNYHTLATFSGHESW